MSSPASPRRPPDRGSAKSTPTRVKPLDIGEPLGPHDTNSVREKVRKWQRQGGGVVTTIDPCADFEDEETVLRDMKTETNNDGSSRARSRTTDSKREENERAESGNRVRSKSAPRKRVISDEHWKKNRSPPTKSPSNTAPRRRTEVVSKYTQSNYPPREKNDALKGLPDAMRSKKPARDSDGIRVYETPKPTARESRHKKSQSTPNIVYKANNKFKGKDNDDRDDEGSGSGGRNPATKRTSHLSRETRQTRQKSVDYNKSESDLTNRQQHTSGPSSEASQAVDYWDQEDRSPRREPERLATPKETRPAKGRSLRPVADEESRRKSPKNEPSPSPRGHKPSVEDWLSSTPDPFVEEKDPYVHMPAPLKASRKERRPRSHSPVEDKVDPVISEEDGKGRRRTSRRSKRRPKSSSSTNVSSGSPAAESLDIPSRDREEVSPSSGRQGAKQHSKSFSDANKMSMLRESVEEALQESTGDHHSSSDVSEVSSADRPPPLTLRRPFPSTGAHRLSTIASVDTLETSTCAGHDQNPNSRKPSAPQSNTNVDPDIDSEARDQFDPNSLPGPGCGLKRRLTNHADLLSVLSVPAARSRSIRSARSIRTSRSRLANATVDDLMRELSSDETKYMRELRTLVGGVIPVLLTCVLSKSDSAIAAGLFNPSTDPHDDVNFTRPIINMGVSLEKLKSLHKRIPLDNPESLLTWAQGAHRTYTDFLNAWRLGFQDVVVNLAPPDNEDPARANSDANSLYEGMDQDEDGDVVDGEGEKVDVAFLLKRPLVRLKYLAKTFKGLNYISHSLKAEETSTTYQKLVVDARRRFNEEKARLEDEAAANTDATRARSPRTLAVLRDVPVVKNRRVRARDSFNLSMLHSSGQEIDCRTELLLRDNPADNGPGGDLLICEVDNSGRWLLFPPIDCGRVSARNAENKGEIIIMIRGVPGEEPDWKELVSLKAEDDQIAIEWVHMIGLSPVPPRINRSLSFLNRAKEKRKLHPLVPESTEPTSPPRDRSASPTNIDVPIGEQATVVSTITKTDTTRDARSSLPSAKTRSTPATNLSDFSPKSPTVSSLPLRSPKSLNDAMAMAGGTSPTTELKRRKAQRRSKYGELTQSPTSSAAGTPERETSKSEASTRKAERDSPEPKTPTRPSIARPDSPNQDYDAVSPPEPPDVEFERPLGKRSLSPVPSLELPTIPKLRKNSGSSDGEKDGQSIYSQTHTTPATSIPKMKTPIDPVECEEDAFAANQQRSYLDEPPAPPPHRSPSPAQLKQSPIPMLTPPTPRYYQNRRTSSPLKHEYEPSTATESSGSETSTIEQHSSVYSESDTSDEDLEAEDIATPLPPISTRRTGGTSPPSSVPTLPDASLDPSNSASQAPYKTVPSQPSKATKAIASIYYWHDKGSWESLHPDECSILITPGLIEVYDLGPINSQPPTAHGDGPSDSEENNTLGSPLIALELTPLVPIRRGTALDISVRSPPTPRSRLTTGNNVMFRSRNPEECEKLYNLINHSRINNPTYIALQNARGPQPTQPNTLGRQNSVRSNSKLGGLFSWTSKSSYRASSNPTPSVAGVTESSVGTMSSAFSALKRFGAGSKMFSIAKSTITSRTGSRGGSLYSSSAGSGSNSSPANGFENAAEKGAIGGLSSAKIRLYRRETASKWRDMGAARLTILPASPSPSPPGSASNNTTTPDSSVDQIPGEHGAFSPPPVPATSGAAPHRDEKRILIRGKVTGEVLLDACLGESCFERVARTGIAVSVWEEFEGVAKEGGVACGSFSVYMIQMKSEAETAYTFGLVGKLRY